MIDFDAGPPQVAPGETPAPTHPDQVEMWRSPIRVTKEPDKKMEIELRIGLIRHPRQKCSACGNRRICFSVGFSNDWSSPRMCAKCAGIR